VPADDDWAAFPPDSAEAELCREAAHRVYPDGPRPARPPAAVSVEDVPTSLTTRVPPSTSSQDAFGTALVELARLGGPLAERLVTASADVAVSTNLGGWINRQGVFAVEPEPRPIDETPRLLRWQPGPHGQHIELGIAEINLFLLLGQLALSYELNGEVLVPVGTVYDPFVCRGLDALIYGVYSGARFVFAGTPSGISLSPEGGAHQSQITPSIGMELPQIELYEPCFARETEWCLLEGLRQALDREHGLSTYLRLTTKLVDQSLLEPATTRYGEDELRRQVVAGGYRLMEPGDGLEGAPKVLLASAGAMIPEAAAAVGELHAEGIAATLLNLTSASRLYQAWQGSQLAGIRAGRAATGTHQLERLITPAERSAPIITVLDGASHALAFLGGVFGQRVIPLGVDQFGRSGTRGAVYDYAGIDAAHIVSAAVAAVSAS
jgi:pyruvate dehydrogenase E1 component